MTLTANAFRLTLAAGALGAVALIAWQGGLKQPSPPVPVAEGEPPRAAAAPVGAILPALPPEPAKPGALDAIREAARPSGPSVAAYAPDAALVAPPGNPVLRDAPPVNVEIPGLREALAAYRSGDMAKGDEEAARVGDPTARATLAYVAVLKEPRLSSFGRLSAFLLAHPDWAGKTALERRAEDILFADRNRPGLAASWFSTRRPQTPAGKLALARAELTAGREAKAREIVSAVWRNDDMTLWLENQLQKEFGALITDADTRARATRLAVSGKSAAPRIAGKVGEDFVALVKARVAVANENASDKLMQAVPAALQKDPLYLLSKAQRARRSGDLDGALKAMSETTRDAALLGDPDEFWTERRVLARKLLDANRLEDAYRLCAQHSATGREAFIEAEFHAGWIALRFLKDAARAAPHFDLAAAKAETPISKARTAYWQGRAAEALGDRERARERYETAAAEPIAYYGQLARARLGGTIDDLRRPREVARGEQRAPATRVVEMLFALGETEMAASLANETVRSMRDEPQIAALTDVVARTGDARVTLAVGKQAVQRGHKVDEAAYPTFGIPAFEPLGTPAPMPVVYAIARQESAFAANALSPAGARGLMQMIDSTARKTAQQIGVVFDKDKMVDPSFNAQLGAAHLGELLANYRNSYILTFVAYNAGPRRVREWIEAYGDPRDPAVDPVDWVERIPFTETRNYVQRVTENLEIYRLRFGDTRPFAIRADLRGLEQRL